MAQKSSKKAFFVSDKNALIQYHNSEFDNENNGQFFYASKDVNGAFQKTINYDPVPSLYGYNSQGIKTIAFDENNNLYSIHWDIKKYDPENIIPGDDYVRRLAAHDNEGNLLWTKSINAKSFSLNSDNNGGIIVGNYDYNSSNVAYTRYSTNDGSVAWTSQPYTPFLDGGFGASSRSIQVLDDGSFLAASSGYLNTNGGGTNLAKFSLEDGSLQSLLSGIDNDLNYTTHELFNSNDKIYLRTNNGSHEINPGAQPIAEHFPKFQASDTTAPELTSVTFSGLTNNTVDVSQGPVTISTDVTFIETQSGFDDLEMDWTSPSGQSININESPLIGNTKSGTFTFSQYAEAGTWTLDISEFHDSEGNGNSYSAEELAALGIQSSLTVVNSNNPEPAPTPSPSPAPSPSPSPAPTPTSNSFSGTNANALTSSEPCCCNDCDSKPHFNNDARSNNTPVANLTPRQHRRPGSR